MAAAAEETVAAVLMWPPKGAEGCEMAAAAIAVLGCLLHSWRRHWESVEHVERRILGGIGAVNVRKRKIGRYLSTPPRLLDLTDTN